MFKPTMKARSVILLSLLFAAFPAFGDSKARVVRLSDVQGNVQIDRNTGQGFEKAFLNLPITEGMKVRTGEEGRAALEFEDGSALRLAPQSKIEFQTLSLRDSGTKISTVKLDEGTVYVNFQGAKDNELSVNFVRQSLALSKQAHLRISLGDAEASVAVFNGDAQVTGPAGTLDIAKNHTVRFDLAQDTYKLAKNVDEETYDNWDKQQNQYQQTYSDKTYASYSPYAYGTSDLNYYGSWYSLPGYGQLWQPYFTGAGWDPYQNGSWTAFSGGYGWVSAYPWGWTPYNYGAWNFVSPYGWMWQPGGAWMGGYPVPVFLNAPVGFAAPRTPIFPGPRVVRVNHGSSSILSGNSRIQIPENSAGLGIPRGGIQNLSQVSSLAEQRGSATTKLHFNTPATSGWWRGGAYNRPQGMNWGTRSMSSGTMSTGHASAGHVSGGGGVHH